MKFAKEAFRFKQFSVLVYPDVFPVSTDSVLLGSWIDLDQSNNILDIGTGSGLLALMAAQKSANHAQITAIDLDENAVQCANYNFEQSPWRDKGIVKCLDAVLLLNHADENQQEFGFDHIISNPPYFSDSLLSLEKAKNRARHQEALNYNLLASIANTCINDNGKMSLVLPFSDEDVLVNLMAQYRFNPTRILRVRNKINAKIKRVLLEFSKSKAPCQESDLFLYNDQGKRSEDYSVLSNDFYI